MIPFVPHTPKKRKSSHTTLTQQDTENDMAEMYTIVYRDCRIPNFFALDAHVCPNLRFLYKKGQLW